MGTKQFIGIDFGTTNTAVFEYTTDESGITNQRILSENGAINAAFPSIIAITNDNSHYLIGNIVKKEKERLSETHSIIKSFKTFLNEENPISINGASISPVQLVSYYLQAIKKRIFKVYNIDISEASFSYPVDFGATARRQLAAAAEDAGINVTSMISESTAAYLACKDGIGVYQNVMVIDWGGGTLDMSILKIERNKVFEKSIYGIKFGGDDIDILLAERMHANVNRMAKEFIKKKAFEDISLSDRDKMISLREEAKIEISNSQEDYLATLQSYGDYGTQNFVISVDEFEGIVSPLIRTKVVPAIAEALKRSEMTPSSIDAVIIAGGSSKLLSFMNAVINIFGQDKIFCPVDLALSKSTVEGNKINTRGGVQFVSAKGAAFSLTLGDGFKLNEGIGILMSDNSVYPLFKGQQDGEGASVELTFSLVEDTQDAHFIITNESGTHVYDKFIVPTKGFLRENLKVNASITKYQTILLNVNDQMMSDKLKDTSREITGMTMYYDLSNSE